MSATASEGYSATLIGNADGVLRFSGTVTGPEAVRLRADGEKALAQCQGNTCNIDLTGVENASSILLSLLLCWKRFAADKGVSVSFSGANQRLVALATMSRVAGYLPGLVPR